MSTSMYILYTYHVNNWAIMCITCVQTFPKLKQTETKKAETQAMTQVITQAAIETGRVVIKAMSEALETEQVVGKDMQ